MKLFPRAGRGLDDMPEDEALALIFLLVTKIKDPKLLLNAVVAGALCLTKPMDGSLTEVLEGIIYATREWDKDEEKNRLAMLVSMADQMEASYAEFKERVYKEGVEPYDSA